MATHKAHSSDWRDVNSPHPGQPRLEYIGGTTGWYKAPRWSDQEGFDRVDERHSEQESVYLFHSKKAGRVKIGRSKQVYKRFSAVRASCPYDDLEILDILPDESEGHLHHKFRNFRSHGEWFNDDVLEELGYEK